MRPEAAATAQFDTPEALRQAMHDEGGRLRGSAHLAEAGDFYQWGGMRLHAQRFQGFDDGRAQFAAVDGLAEPS